MDVFLRDVNYDIFGHYIYEQLPQGTQIENHDYSVSFLNHDYQIQVQLWHNKIIEFQKYDNQTVNYYLHFEFINFQKSNQLFKEFLNYSLNNLKEYKVLICCTGGLTSTFFAEGLKDYLKHKNTNIIVEACSYVQINKPEEYDLILLAPQLNYLYYQFHKYHNVEMIPSSLYATYNYSEIYHFISKRRTV